MTVTEDCLHARAWSRATYLAQLAMGADDLEQAKEQYIDALNAALQIRWQTPIYYAQTLVGLASLMLMQQDADSAIALLQDALPIYATTYPPCHRKMLELYHLIANAHHAAHLYDDADHWYQLTLENMGHLPWNHRDKQTASANYLRLLAAIDQNENACAS